MAQRLSQALKLQKGAEKGHCPPHHGRVNTDLPVSVLATDIVLGWVRTKIIPKYPGDDSRQKCAVVSSGIFIAKQCVFFCCWRALDMYQKMLSIVDPHRIVSRQEQKIHDMLIHMCTHTHAYIYIYVYTRVCVCARVCIHICSSCVCLMNIPHVFEPAFCFQTCI